MAFILLFTSQLAVLSNYLSLFIYLFIYLDNFKISLPVTDQTSVIIGSLFFLTEWLERTARAWTLYNHPLNFASTILLFQRMFRPTLGLLHSRTYLLWDPWTNFHTVCCVFRPATTVRGFLPHSFHFDSVPKEVSSLTKCISCIDRVPYFHQ